MSTSLCLHLLLLGAIAAWRGRPREVIWVNLLEARLLRPEARENIVPVPAPSGYVQSPPAKRLPQRPRTGPRATPGAARSDSFAAPEAILPAVSGSDEAASVSAAAVAGKVEPLASPAAEAAVAADPLTGPTETVEQRYLREQFAYIRERVLARLVYPSLARRQGWTGLVKVSFTVCVDGTIEELQVVAGSGRTLLDQQALRAVQAAAPFPPPPARASIILPVFFAVETASR